MRSILLITAVARLVRRHDHDEVALVLSDASRTAALGSEGQPADARVPDPASSGSGLLEAGQAEGEWIPEPSGQSFIADNRSTIIMVLGTVAGIICAVCVSTGTLKCSCTERLSAATAPPPPLKGKLAPPLREEWADVPGTSGASGIPGSPKSPSGEDYDGDLPVYIVVTETSDGLVVNFYDDDGKRFKGEQTQHFFSSKGVPIKWAEEDGMLVVETEHARASARAAAKSGSAYHEEVWQTRLPAAAVVPRSDEEAKRLCGARLHVIDFQWLRRERRGDPSAESDDGSGEEDASDEGAVARPEPVHAKPARKTRKTRKTPAH